MITAKTYRTADRYALDLTAYGVSLAKTARAAKRDRTLTRRRKQGKYCGHAPQTEKGFA